MAFTDPITVGTRSYSRITPGEYIDMVSTLDEPRYLVLKSTMKATGVSSFTIRISVGTNVLDGPDDVSDVYIVVRGNMSTLTDASIRERLNEIKTLVDIDSVMARIRRGEL